ncbi:MAG: HK97 gp10 family phage protein [Lachnospiraceae bacterium]|nr:HK97 gp10 family phage protein [Lachnospiraceae bacterium]
MADKGPIQLTVADNSEVFKAASRMAIAVALEDIGSRAEAYAKRELTKSKAVDTGRLRNSVTHATSNYSGQGHYTDNYKNIYTDATARQAVEGQAVFVGTNAEYAAYVEMGTGDLGTGTGKKWVYRDGHGNYHATSGMAARPYIKPAIADHLQEYRAVIKQWLENAPDDGASAVKTVTKTIIK